MAFLLLLDLLALFAVSFGIGFFAGLGLDWLLVRVRHVTNRRFFACR
jgi:hypothetical protein